MSNAKNGDTVKVHYTGTLEDGTVFDSSAESEPLEFTLGNGQLIKGFEDAVLGMSIGEKKQVKISYDETYGTRKDELILKFDRAAFPPSIEPREGLVLNLKSPEGRLIVAEIKEISGDSVTLDANHPLAGKDLTFEINLMEIA